MRKLLTGASQAVPIVAVADFLQPIGAFSFGFFCIASISILISLLPLGALKLWLHEHRPGLILVWSVSGGLLIWQTFSEQVEDRGVLASQFSTFRAGQNVMIGQLAQISASLEKIEASSEETAATVSETQEIISSRFFPVVEVIEEARFFKYGSSSAGIKAIVDDAEYVVIEGEGSDQGSASNYGYYIEDVQDLDNDGYMDAIVGYWGGGNCCEPSPTSIISHRGGNNFETRSLNNVQSIERYIRTKRNTLIIEANSFSDIDGLGGKLKLELTEYGIELLSDAKETQKFALAEVLASEAFERNGSRDQRVQLEFDLNKDGDVDVVDCGYWQRWHVIQDCTVRGQSYGVSFTNTISMQCKRLAVSDRVINGWYMLLCDQKEFVYSDDVDAYVERS